MNPTDRLLALLIPFMEQEGYAYRKSNHRFLKPFANGNYEFSLTFDGRGGFVTVTAGFFVYFDAVLKHFKKILGYACPWTAGATLLNAGANPWQVRLFDQRFAAMSPQERSGVPSEVIHPDSRIEAGVHFLKNAHGTYAAPFFQRLQTYCQLADFYREYFQSGGVARCRPLPENVVYLSLILAACLGERMEEIVAFSQGVGSCYVGHNVASKVQAVVDYVRSNDLTRIVA
jgi:hypothetical protein